LWRFLSASTCSPIIQQSQAIVQVDVHRPPRRIVINAVSGLKKPVRACVIGVATHAGIVTW
jgi:hypothetical protein